MSKTASLAKPTGHDATLLAVVRFAIVSGCASALIMARYPLPF